MLVTRMPAFLVLLVALGWSSVATALPIEWTVASGGNGHFYEAVYTGTRIYWDDAETLAEAAGGYLATVTSVQEHAWVVANVLPLIPSWQGDNAVGPWVGGYQDTSSPSYSEPGGGWSWVTGEAWDYTNWLGTEPNDSPIQPGPENYLHYATQGGISNAGWNDNGVDLDHLLVDSYIIEVVPEPSTALLLGMGMVGLAARERRRPA
jgi:hypothetical protein